MSVPGAVEDLLDDDPRRIGPYEIVGVLGTGGMGRVYLGEAADSTRAAVKVVHADLARNPEFRRRFAREAALAGRLSGPDHPYIAAVLAADVEDARPWLATEYVPALSLHAVVTAEGPLAPEQVRALGVDLARALTAIHEAGLVHRDVKPPNILLADGGPKLIDFGIARDAALSTMTRTGVLLGTPQAMAPEQLDGTSGQIGPPTDVFALGGVLCYAATGRYPFGDGDPTALSYRIVHRDPDLTDVPGQLRALIARCLAKDPADRPTAAGVAAALLTPQTHAATPDPAAGSEAAAPDGRGEEAAEAPGPVPDAAETGAAEPGRADRRRRRLMIGGGAGVTLALLVAVSLAMESAAGGVDDHRRAQDAAGTSPTAASPAGDPGTGGRTPSPSPGPATSTAATTASTTAAPTGADPTAPTPRSGGSTPPSAVPRSPTPVPAGPPSPPATQDPNTVPARFLGAWAGPMRMTGPGMDAMANVSIDLVPGGVGRQVGVFTLTTSSNAYMCSGHYVLTSVGSDGTTNMSAIIDKGSGCANANVHVSSCSCAGNQIHWLADGQILTKNEGVLTYQHA